MQSENRPRCKAFFVCKSDESGSVHNTCGHYTTRVNRVATHLHYVVREGINAVTVEPESLDRDESDTVLNACPRGFRVQYLRFRYPQSVYTHYGTTSTSSGLCPAFKS